MLEKYNFCLHRKKRHQQPATKYERYYMQNSPTEIRKTLVREAEDYTRKVKKIPDMFNCITYITKEGKVAVLPLNTPRRRLEYFRANEHFTKFAMDEVKEKYGFIPRPINVLKKYVDYGYMTSQDVEHLYHYQDVDWKIGWALETFKDAYRVNFQDKDILADHFNGYSCMSEEPQCGAFYYYFGAFILVFYKKGTKEIVGRAILWKHNKQLYVYKGYVKTPYQIKAAEVVRTLEEKGKLKRGLPLDFSTQLQRMGNKTPEEIYDEICETIRVPYIDEDLCLSSDKTELSFGGYYKCKGTGCYTLNTHGIYTCDECGDEVDEEDIVEVHGNYYCTNCAKYCHGCDEWYDPDEDGEYVDGEWYCEDCLSDRFSYCDCCHSYTNDNVVDFIDEWGDTNCACEECVDSYCTECDECKKLFYNNCIIKENGGNYCKECYNKIKGGNDEN